MDGRQGVAMSEANTPVTEQTRELELRRVWGRSRERHRKVEKGGGQRHGCRNVGGDALLRIGRMN